MKSTVGSGHLHTHIVIIDLMDVFRLLSIDVHKDWPKKKNKGVTNGVK